MITAQTASNIMGYLESLSGQLQNEIGQSGVLISSNREGCI
jgi:hypothetical protein